MVEEFLRSNGFSSQTGYIGEVQKKQFSEYLPTLSSIQKVVEIGFNAGHSAECFFQYCANLDVFVSFDINMFPYTKPAVEYFQKLYSNRFFFIEGNSLMTVPAFAKHFPRQKFDLIYIDGGHAFENVVGDIFNAKLLAHSETILWLDDYHFKGVNQAIQFCEAMGWIRTEKLFSLQDPKDPKRAWVELKYI